MTQTKPANAPGQHREIAALRVRLPQAMVMTKLTSILHWVKTEKTPLFTGTFRVCTRESLTSPFIVDMPTHTTPSARYRQRAGIAAAKAIGKTSHANLTAKLTGQFLRKRFIHEPFVISGPSQLDRSTVGMGLTCAAALTVDFEHILNCSECANRLLLQGFFASRSSHFEHPAVYSGTCSSGT